MIKLSESTMIVFNEMVRTGDEDKAIAKRLNRHHKTIKMHNQKIFRAYGVNSTKQVLAKIIQAQEMSIQQLRSQVSDLISEKHKLKDINKKLRPPEKLPVGKEGKC